MKTKIAKDFHWEMGHRLPFHKGGCQNIHGHSYKMRVEFEGDPDETGMVMDYNEMRDIIAPIVERFDHSFTCDKSDTVLMNFFEKNPMKINVVDFFTTAENLAQYILGEITEKISSWKNISKVTVRLHETERTYAEVAMMVGGNVNGHNKENLD